MSYCRFNNTELDLQDCVTALEELYYGNAPKLSRSELHSAREMMDLAEQFLRYREFLEEMKSEEDEEDEEAE